MKDYYKQKPPDEYLKGLNGVIHIGANSGQERDLYLSFDLEVLWIEPIPEIFNLLVENIKPYLKQKALNYLITDKDNLEYVLHVANNNGASSSILEFRMHKDIWPEVKYERDIRLKSITLPLLLGDSKIECRQYEALILDTQGSELLILRGAAQILPNFKYIKIEVPNFESYSGCCKLTEVGDYLANNGFTEYSRMEFARHISGGSYYDIVYENTEFLRKNNGEAS
jgi:FkbM family methyltransferase